MTAIWKWDRISFDYLDTGFSEGFGRQESFTLPAPFSLQRVICRFGTTGTTLASITDADLAAPGWLWEATVFAELPDEHREYYHSASGAVVTSDRHVGQGQQTVQRETHFTLPALDVDVAARLRVPDSTGGYFVGFALRWTPVPMQNPTSFLYRSDWRTVGQLAWLISGTP